MKATREKINIDTARELFRSNGAILLSTVIDKGQETLLDYLCSCGQKDTKTYKNFRNTPRCNYKNHKELIEKKQEFNKSFSIKVPDTPKKVYLSIMNSETIQKPSEIHSRNWNLSKLKLHTDKIYGEEKILLNKVPENITCNVPFFVDCSVCSYTWSTNTETLISRETGCPWCKDECANIKNYNLYIVSFIGNKIHKNKYNYSLVNETPIFSSECLVQISCKIDGHKPKIQTVLEHLKRKVGKRCCDECEILKPKKVQQEWFENLERFLKKARKIHGDNYDYSLIKKEDLQNANSKIQIICKRSKYGEICNNNFFQSLRCHIYNKNGCSICTGKNYSYNKEIFVERAEARYEDKFSYDLFEDGDIVDSSSKLKIKCNNCSYVMTGTSINSFLNSPSKKQCENCEGGVMKWTAFRLKNECEEKEKEGMYFYDEIDFNIDPVHGVESSIKVGCKFCCEKGYKIYYFYPTINNHFNNKSGCPRCSGTMPWNYDRFMSDIPKLYEKEFDYSQITPEMITSAESEIPIRHLKCEVTFYRTVDSHIINMKGCNFCAKSQAEQITFMILRKHNIYFKDEHPCPGLFKNSVCYFDYVCFFKGVYYIIELDGKQHFLMQEFFGGEEDFLVSRKRDIHKHYLAINNNFKIIRIDYTVSNSKIEEHLLKALNSDEKEYFSNPEMYQWLIEGVKNYNL